MIHPAIPVALLALAAPAAVAQDIQGQDLSGIELAQLSIRERIIIRIPRVVPRPLRPGRTPLSPPVEWRERKGPECVPMGALAGAMVTGRDTIDLLMADGGRMRAKLDGDCRPLDFYSAYYIRRTEDGQVCADRDSIRSRSGSVCAITKFRRMEARR